MKIARTHIVTASVGFLSATAGTFGGYFFAKKKFAKIAQEEIDSVKETYRKLTANHERYRTPEEAVEALVEDVEQTREELAEKVTTLSYAEETVILQSPLEDKVVRDSLDLVEEKPDPEARTQNLWNTPQPTATELGEFVSQPSEEEPYIISVDEYMETGFDDFNKVTYLYFEADDTLVDDNEELVPDVAGTIGLETLEQFGVGSKDPTVVHVRNLPLSTDFEVHLDKRSYVDVFYGNLSGDEDNGRPLRMRNDE